MWNRMEEVHIASIDVGIVHLAIADAPSQLSGIVHLASADAHLWNRMCPRLQCETIRLTGFCCTTQWFRQSPQQLCSRNKTASDAKVSLSPMECCNPPYDDAPIQPTTN